MRTVGAAQAVLVLEDKAHGAGCCDAGEFTGRRCLWAKLTVRRAGHPGILQPAVPAGVLDLPEIGGIGNIGITAFFVLRIGNRQAQLLNQQSDPLAPGDSLLLIAGLRCKPHRHAALHGFALSRIHKNRGFAQADTGHRAPLVHFGHQFVGRIEPGRLRGILHFQPAACVDGQRQLCLFQTRRRRLDIRVLRSALTVSAVAGIRRRGRRGLRLSCGCIAGTLRFVLFCGLLFRSAGFAVVRLPGRRLDFFLRLIHRNVLARIMKRHQPPPQQNAQYRYNAHRSSHPFFHASFSFYFVFTGQAYGAAPLRALAFHTVIPQTVAPADFCAFRARTEPPAHRFSAGDMQNLAPTDFIISQ